MRLKKLLILLILINYSLFAFDSVEVLNPNITIHKSGYFKTDKDLSLEEVLDISKNTSLLKLSKKAYSFGFDNNTYWFVFEISNTSDDELFFDSRNMVGNNQDLYILNNNKLLKHYKNGFDVATKNRDIKSFPIRFQLEKSPNTLTYFFKVESKVPLYTAFAFGNEKEVDKDWYIMYIIMIVTSSIFIGFFIYNLFLYYITKDKAYLFYCIYIFGFFAFNFIALGYPLIFMDNIENYIFPIFIFIKLFGLTFFAIYFLKLHEKQKRDKNIFLFLLGLIAILSVFYVFALALALYALVIQILHFFSIYIGIKSYRNGNKYAMHYLIATGMSNILSLGFIFMNQGQFVPFNLLTINLINIALIWELIMLSLALANRIRLLQNESIRNEQLAMIKSKQTSIGELSGNIAHQWRQPLAELSSIIVNTEAKIRFSSIEKEELLKQFELSSKILKHLSSTIDTFQGFFQNERIETTFCVNDEIKRCIEFVNDSMKNNGINIIFTEEKDFYLIGKANEFSQIILNIVLNAKDMFCQRNIQNREIKIDIKSFNKSFNKSFKIEISDNAGGIEIKPIESIFESYITSKDKGIGIGLFIVKTIVEQKFNGKIEVINNKSRADETLFLLIFP